MGKLSLRHSKAFRLKLTNSAEDEHRRIFAPVPHFTTEWRREVGHGTSRLPITSYLEEEALVIHNYNKAYDLSQSMFIKLSP